MQKLSIQGGVPLSGEVRVAGAKNAALPILAASLLTAAPMRITNVPQLNDVGTMVKLLARLGAKVEGGAGEFHIDARLVGEAFAPYDLVKTMRASILVLGPLLARFGEARVSLPGGCAIGERPVDLHIKGLTAMGAHIGIEAGYIHASATRLKGARLRIATKYIRTTREHFAAKGVHVDLIKLYGSMELAPLVGLADAIVDLVDTGNTLRANKLKVVEEMLPISSRLIVNPASLKLKREAIAPLIEAFRRAVGG